MPECWLNHDDTNFSIFKKDLQHFLTPNDGTCIFIRKIHVLYHKIRVLNYLQRIMHIMSLATSGFVLWSSKRAHDIHHMMFDTSWLFCLLHHTMWDCEIYSRLIHDVSGDQQMLSLQPRNRIGLVLCQGSKCNQNKCKSQAM